MENKLEPLFNGGTTPSMPMLFVGHGSPTNGIADNMFTREWAELGRTLPRPTAILCISAHWLTRGTRVTAMEKPRTIHDFGGFPDELYQVQYPATGHPAMANDVCGALLPLQVALDHEWGLDHGCWTILKHMYPNADVPVLQLSIDQSKPHAWHYQTAQQLAALRQRGVLIMASGNMVHNLGRVAWDRLNDEDYGFDWALEADRLFKQLIEQRDHRTLINYEGLGQSVNMAVPTPDHFWPLLYTLGLQNDKDQPRFFNDRCTAGSLSMTSVLWNS